MSCPGEVLGKQHSSISPSLVPTDAPSHQEKWVAPIPRSKAPKPKLPWRLLPAPQAGEPGPAVIRGEQLQLTRQADACRSLTHPRRSNRQVQPSGLAVPAGIGPGSPAAVGQQRRCWPKHLFCFACPAAHTYTLKKRGMFFPPLHSGLQGRYFIAP